MKTKDQEAFSKAYGCSHFCAELAERMCDENGKLKPTTPQQIAEFQKAAQDTACAARALRNTMDGRPV